MRYVIRDSLVRTPAHQLKVLADLRIVEDFQKRRLLEVDGESFAQRSIKNRIASVVGEFGQYQYVLVGERRRTDTLLQEQESGNDHQDRRGSCGGVFPRTASSFENSLDVPLQVSSRLPTVLWIFGEARLQGILKRH